MSNGSNRFGYTNRIDSQIDSDDPIDSGRIIGLNKTIYFRFVFQ